MSKLLIGETQEELAESMRAYFLQENFSVQLAFDERHIFESLCETKYDIVILDTKLLESDGLSVIRQYRSSGGDTPIVLLSNTHSSIELQNSLEAGADSYLVKPVVLGDLSACLKAMLRRPVLRREELLHWGGIILNAESAAVTRDNVEIHLCPMEYKLLYFLLRHQNQLFSTKALFQRLWQSEGYINDDTVKTHIRSLRRKLDLPGCPSIITTIRGLGYKISAYADS